MNQRIYFSVKEAIQLKNDIKTLNNFVCSEFTLKKKITKILNEFSQQFGYTSYSHLKKISESWNESSYDKFLKDLVSASDAKKHFINTYPEINNNPGVFENAYNLWLVPPAKKIEYDFKLNELHELINQSELNEHVYSGEDEFPIEFLIQAKNRKFKEFNCWDSFTVVNGNGVVKEYTIIEQYSHIYTNQQVLRVGEGIWVEVSNGAFRVK
ncbi:hypothetical protein [Vibrio parahaemolyticus]|uniref:hypothetical protein n=1 Tax=Vibrio parahaemolyticus TaxID=670 RepID=UPI003D7EE117